MPRQTARPFQAVLFDFDGTLAHLTLDFKHMRKLVLAELAAILGPEHAALMRDDLPVMEMIYAACAGENEDVTAEIAARTERAVSAYELEASAASSLFPYAKALLSALRERGLKTAIVTRNCRAAVEKIFPAHATLCDALISRGEVPPEDLKPKPGQLQAALAALGCPPNRALMVGDHPMDVVSGKAAGCLTAGVLSGNATRAMLEEAGPDWLAADSAELFTELGLFP